MDDKKPLKIRILSDSPIEFRVVWVILILFLVIIVIFLANKIGEKCPDVVCTECKECPQCPKLDCTTCPVKIDYKDVIKKVYVCQDGSEVENADDCIKKKTNTSDIKLVTTNEDGSHIQKVSLKPACYKGINGGEINFSLDATPKSFYFEVKEVGEDYAAKPAINGLIKSYRYFTICDVTDTKCKSEDADFYLEKHKLYILRAAFDFTNYNWGKAEYSNEHLVDTTDGSDYMVKKCSG